MAQKATSNGAPAGLLDAAERLLISEGHAAISTRRVAEEAALNHGLVHYYFGSMEELFVQVLERFTDRLIERQRALYADDAPFIEKWRAAMNFLETDHASGYQKIWFELQALAWNRPELRDRIGRVNAEWRSVLADAFEGVVSDYEIDTSAFPVSAIVSLVMTFNEGMILERLSGITEGQQDLLNVIDRWLGSLERSRG